MPSIPTFHEWVVFIQQNPVQAKQLMVSLHTLDKKQGLMSDPALIISIEHYEQAEHLLVSKANNPKLIERVAYVTRLGQAMLRGYPIRDEWVVMIKDDPKFARDLCIAWETKRALLGLQTPQALLRSIETYYTVSAAQ